MFKQKPFVYLLLATLLLAQTVFAQSDRLHLLYQNVDSAFAHKSDAELHSLLAQNRDDADYRQLESYVIQKIKRLIAERDYRLAMLADLAVLDNNLANEDAVELYSAIINAQEQQKALKAAVSGQLEDEEDADGADTEEDAESGRAQTATAADSAAERQRAWRYFWLFKFGMFDGAFFTVTDKKSGWRYHSFRYGISADLIYEQAFQPISVGIDFSSAAVIVPLYNGDGALTGSVRVIPTLSIKKFSEYAQARAGFACFIKKETTDVSPLHKTVYTPVIGCGFAHIAAGRAQVSGSIDYYPGHFAYPDLLAALGGAFNCRIPLTTLDKISLHFNIGLKDILFIKDNGIENRTGLTLSVGVGNRKR